MEVKIEKCIPIPNRAGHRSGLTAALRSLEVGDSFLWPKTKRASIIPAATLVRIKVATRAEGDHVRVWRIAEAA